MAAYSLPAAVHEGVGASALAAAAGPVAIDERAGPGVKSHGAHDDDVDANTIAVVVTGTSKMVHVYEAHAKR